MAALSREDLKNIKTATLDADKGKDWIKVSLSTSGIAAGALEVQAALRDELRKRGVSLTVKRTGGTAICYPEPIIEVNVAGAPAVIYGDVTEEGARRIVAEHVVGKKVVEELKAPISDKQLKIVLRNCGEIDPENIKDYIARDGYEALAKVLFDMKPEEAIAALTKSGLRGRGGAGFPTALKWQLTRKESADQKFIICNGDEGDPGAYMDRSVLESDPHSVIEGMIIGGYLIGATKGFFYIRAEYPLAIERIEKALKQARLNGLLGENIMGSTFSFDVEIRLGAGAFVCGEETALIASIEGKRGTPKPRPPFPSVKGLWDKPTCINNVETLANVAEIFLKGADWFAGIGHGKSRGTKVFAVTGKVKYSGLVEVPMGTSLRDIVFDVCGGAADGKKVKAIQTGGPSGGVIPEAHFDTPISYETLQELGSIMGSGGMIVMDEDDSIVEIAKFYLGFCVDESCGKCAPCRIGGVQMLKLLEKICDKKGTPDDITALRRICHSMQTASLCGLGQTAPNPVLSSLRYFEHEYAACLKATPVTTPV